MPSSVWRRFTYSLTQTYQQSPSRRKLKKHLPHFNRQIDNNVVWQTSTNAESYSVFLRQRTKEISGQTEVNSLSYSFSRRKKADWLILEYEPWRQCGALEYTVLRIRVGRLIIRKCWGHLDSLDKAWTLSGASCLRLPFQDLKDARWITYWNYSLLLNSMLSRDNLQFRIHSVLVAVLIRQNAKPYFSSWSGFPNKPNIDCGYLSKKGAVQIVLWHQRRLKFSSLAIPPYTKWRHECSASSFYERGEASFSFGFEACFTSVAS